MTSKIPLRDLVFVAQFWYHVGELSCRHCIALHVDRYYNPRRESLAAGKALAKHNIPKMLPPYRFTGVQESGGGAAVDKVEQLSYPRFIEVADAVKAFGY